jgi:DNA polymerase III alpha subunit
MDRASVEAEPLLIQGEVEGSAEGAKILVKSIEWLEDAHKNRVQQVVLKIPMDRASPEQLRELKKSIIQFRGKCPIRIEFQDDKFKTKLELPKNVGLQTTPQMVESVNKIFGFNVVHLV